MRTIAAIRADLETSDIGTRSRLADEFEGLPVLRRTVERAARIAGIDSVIVMCRVGQRERCERMLAGTGAVVCDFKSSGEAGLDRTIPADSPWRMLSRTARKWSLDGWRGGIGGACYFDEFTDIPLLDGLLGQHPADAVLSLPAAAPLLSVQLAERMIDHRRKDETNARLVFTQAVPGLAGVLLDATLVRELAQKNIPVGVVFSYKPDSPQKDLIFQPCCLDLPSELRFATGRLVADTDRAWTCIAELIEAHPDCALSACEPGEELSPAAIGQWLCERDDTYVEPLPREVEIELTTDDPYPDSIVRPRGPRAGHGSIDPRLVASVAAELAEYDDSLLVLGGFGDPLRHPEIGQILGAIRTFQGGDGVFGLAIRTTGVDLTNDLAGALVDHRVDVVNFLLDAWNAETYARLHSPGNPSRANLETVLGRMQRLAEVRQAAASVAPIIVPEFCKCRENVAELDEFFDGWLRRLGAASLVGFSHFGGQLENRSVMDMRPPVRMPCRRIRSRCMILADGAVVRCDQDFRGTTIIGRLGEQSLRDIWRSDSMKSVRNSHFCGKWDSLDLCRACDEWHRP